MRVLCPSYQDLLERYSSELPVKCCSGVHIVQGNSKSRALMFDVDRDGTPGTVTLFDG